jgi:hypothetical protein
MFVVSIHTALNIGKSLPEDGGEMIKRDLYHVLQTTVVYSEADPAGKRHADVEGSFDSFEEAKKYALTVLLSKEDGVTKDSFSEHSKGGAWRDRLRIC